MLRRAASFTIQPGVGHMMPLEEPREFLRLVRT
jgi:pimeloyl-ACP methyl ester carboxylesterase